MKKIILTALSLFILSVITFGQLKIAIPAIVGPDDADDSQMPDVVLDWTAVINATGYQIVIGFDESLTNPIVDMVTPYSGYQCENLRFNTTYYWKVRGIDGDESSDWTETRSFTTFDALVLDKPSNNASGEEAEIEFKWKNKVGGNNLTGLEYYQIQVDTSSTIFNNENADPFWNITFELVPGTYKYVLSQVFYGETMYWRMRGMHAADTCEWSDVRAFTTDNQIALDKPANGTIGTGLSQFIEWDEFDGTTDYEYQVHTNPSFAGAITYFVDSTEVPAPQLHYGKTYYWRVLGKNMVDTTAWSEVWSFETAGSVILISPFDMADSVPVNPILKWEQITGSNAYQVQYSIDSTFSETVNIFKTTNDIETSPAFNIGATLDEGTEYFWRIRACKVNDTADFSQTWSFTTIGSVDIHEYLNNESIAVFPNPASNNTTLTININKPLVVNFSLTDITGQEIQTGLLNLIAGKNVHTFDLKDISKGIYLINISGGGNAFSKKLIVK